MGDRLMLDASKTNVGVCCWKCRHKRHKFSFAVDWQEGDGCPCCWTHDDGGIPIPGLQRWTTPENDGESDS